MSLVCDFFSARAMLFGGGCVLHKNEGKRPGFRQLLLSLFCSSQHNTTYVVHTYMPSTFLLQVCKIPHRITLPRIVRLFSWWCFFDCSLGLSSEQRERERRSRSTRDYFENRKRRHEDIRSPSPEQGARR